MVHLESHIKTSPEDEKQNALIILNDIIHMIENNKELSPMLDTLVNTLPVIIKAAPTMKNQGRLDVVTCLVALTSLLQRNHFTELFKSLKPQKAENGLWVIICVTLLLTKVGIYRQIDDQLPKLFACLAIP
jgi:hypothetical protein